MPPTIPRYLIVDFKLVLDRSQVGSRASKALEKTYASSTGQPEAKRRALFEQLSTRRDELRDALLARARPIVEAIAKAKEVDLVLEASSVAWSSAEDITQQVIARVDAAGPLT